MDLRRIKILEVADNALCSAGMEYRNKCAHSEKIQITDYFPIL